MIFLNLLMVSWFHKASYNFIYWLGIVYHPSDQAYNLSDSSRVSKYFSPASFISADRSQPILRSLSNTRDLKSNLMASSSAHEHHHRHHHLHTPYGATAAPPPTPSSQPNFSSTSGHADALSLLLHRLPPTLSLSLPGRRSPLPNKTAAVPSVSLSEHAELLSAAKQHGFFQLTRHSVTSELASSAESVARSLFNLPHDRKQLYFPKNWPLGFDAEAADDDDHAGAGGESFCLDSSCSSKETELDLTSLREFTREMEKLGQEVTQALASIVGFDNPAREDPTRISSLLWISEGTSVNTPVLTGRMYPFVIGLQYQIKCQKYHVLTDSGWVSISPEVDSVLVTVGDIAQVRIFILIYFY